MTNGEIMGELWNDMFEDEPIKLTNGGSGSGNFGHSGRPGQVGGSGSGIGGFLFNGDIPSKDPKPTKKGYVVVHHNTDNENANSIAENGLIAGRNLGAYEISPEEGMGIWTDSRAKKDISYGGCTISFQIPEEEYKKYAVNDTQHLIPHDIAKEDIVCIDKIINNNGSNGKPIKVSNLKDNVEFYKKKGLDEDKVISIIAKNSHNTITEQEIKELINYKKKMTNGGPGSGNFGHAGRPGQVGGSAKEGTSSPEVIAVYGKDGDDWETYFKKHTLIEKMRHMRQIVSFTEEHIASMKDAGFSDDEIEQWRAKVLAKDIVSVMKKQKRQELREKAQKSPEQTKAVDNIVNKVKMDSKAETWLRNNCDPEMAQAFSDEVDKANEMGVKNIRLNLNDSKATNGRMGYIAVRDEYELTITKGILRDADEVRQTRKATGPNGTREKTSDSINATFAHEFGHSMESEYVKKLLNGRQITTADFITIRRACSGQIVSQAMKNLANRGISIDTQRQNKDRKYMSNYGRTNSSEAIAESFANPGYSALTQEIHSIVMGKTPLSDETKRYLELGINNAVKKYKEFH